MAGERALAPLLEREREGAELLSAVRAAGQGHGSAALVHGEAGIGKTSLVRAFLRDLDGHARLLLGACDDLRTPRPLGPFRDAAADGAGGLAEALRGADRDAIYSAVTRELSQRAPTVLVVEDVHWADDATLDVLRFLARRLDRLRGVVVLTYRDDEVEGGHPLMRVLGALAGAPVHRLPLRRLSPSAVERLSAGSLVDGAALFDATAGNPFYVTEALGAPEAEVPPTVVDAILARARRLGPASRAALEQLAVIPGQVEPELVDALLGGPGSLVEAEQRGVLQVSPAGVTFRHELARRAIERSLPASRRMGLNRAVVAALRCRGGADLSRVVHHAVEAGDGPTVVECAPQAAREAARAGSHRQALAHCEQALRHAALLPEQERARLLGEYSWELYNAHRFPAAADAAQAAVDLWEGIGATEPLGEALVALSRHRYMALQPDAARAAIAGAVEIFESTGDAAALAYARTYNGALLTYTDRREQGIEQLNAARELAEQASRPDQLALVLVYLGCARCDGGDAGGLELVRQGIDLARTARHHEHLARGYANMARVTLRLGHFEEVARWVEEGLAFVRDRGFSSHAYSLEAHRCLLLAVRGEWEAAEAGARALLRAVEDPGVLGRLTMPLLGRLLARRGDPAAADLVTRTWQLALRADAIMALAPARIARVEWAWLQGNIALARPQIETLLARTGQPGTPRWRGELLRYMARAGLPAAPFEGCPEEYAAGLRGEWQAAAGAWRRIGDPYEEALELAWSGEIDPMIEGLEALDRLGATAPARVVRQRLRDLRCTRVPRGPAAATRSNPAGLTDRQLDVLVLLAEGLTNAEIGERLVVSTRTVDHHVSAILAKLGVASRQEAARTAAELDLVRV